MHACAHISTSHHPFFILLFVLLKNILLETAQESAGNNNNIVVQLHINKPTMKEAKKRERDGWKEGAWR